MKVKLWKVKCNVLYDGHVVKEDVVCAGTISEAMKVAVTNNPNFAYQNIRAIEYVKDVDLNVVAIEEKPKVEKAKRPGNAKVKAL